ncbi:MAG: CoA transferase [Deltaproteobacteria bacterium]|nr:CoA transferase [Deltaproteobacteria bacterium]
MSQTASLGRPLAGIRVLDLSRVLSGPICGRLLVDLGADVVKVEEPVEDILRAQPPILAGVGSLFAQVNAGKRNVSIDLKADGAAALVGRLAAQSDVLIENFRPGVLARFGLDAATLCALHPRLVYCSITGWGQSGPWSDRAAYAPVIHAEAGLLALSQRLRDRPHHGEIQQHADVYAGLFASNAILAALFQRERVGLGQHLDIAMGQALLYLNEHATAELAGHPGSFGFPTWGFETFALANGRLVHLLGDPVRQFPELADALGIALGAEDPLRVDPALRSAQGEQLLARVREAFGQVADFDALKARLAALPTLEAEVRSTRELAESAWAAERGVLAELAPALRVPAAPWRGSGAEIGLSKDALAAGIAGRGEHNRAVLEDWLALPDDELNALEARGVLSEAPRAKGNR